MSYEIFSGQDINGKNGVEFMKRNTHLKGVVYLIKDDNNNVVEVQSKDILSKIYEIDKSLSDDEFVLQYFLKGGKL